MEAMDLLRMIAALAFVLALFGFGLMALKRLNILSLLNICGSNLRLDSSLSLDQRHRVVLVQCRDREHLLLLGPNGDLHIESMPTGKKPAPDRNQEDQPLHIAPKPPKLVVDRS